MAATRTTTASDKRVTVVSAVRAIPAWGWLTLLVAVSAVIRYSLSRQAVAPWIMVDELIYSELAKSFASSGQFLIRDHSTAAYGVIYPALISPAWAVFKTIPDAYAAAKAINSVMMSLAAIPAYLLARRMLSTWWALGAAVLTVALPSMVYTGTLMTENAFYPIFLFAVLAVVVWIERPSTTTTLWVVALIALAYLTRAQALSFGPAILTAPLLYAWAQRRGWRALKDYRLMYGLVVAGGLLVIIVQVARGSSPLGILGAYQVAGETHYHFWPVVEWFWYQLGVLDLSLGVVPLAALIVLCAVSRGQDKRVQAFLAGSIAVTFWLMLEVSAFASVHQLRVEERNTFYVVPLFLIALLVWIDRGTPRPGRLAAARGARRRRAPGRAPVPAPDHDERGLGHADAAPDLVAADVAVPDRADGARRRARVHVRRRAVGARAPPLRTDPPGADPRLLRGLAEADRGEAQDGVGRRALRGDHAAARLGRPGGRARPGGGDDLVGAGEPVRDLGERDLQPQRAALLLPALAARRRPPRAEGEGRSGVGRDAGRREARRRPLRARRQLGPARRQIAPPGPAHRHDAVRDCRAAAAGLAGDRPLPERHVVRALRLVHAPRVPRRAAEGRPPE